MTRQQAVDESESQVCLPSSVVTDGMWHTVIASRHGHNLLLEIDDGDQIYERNETLLTLEKMLSDLGPPSKLVVDKQDGISMGGKPYFSGINVINVGEDFYESEFFSNRECIIAKE